MALDGLQVELTVVLGKTRMPLHRALRIGRGAVVALDGTAEDDVEILANGHPIARGRVTVSGGAIMIEMTELVRKLEVTRLPGCRIGGGTKTSEPQPTAAA